MPKSKHYGRGPTPPKGTGIKRQPTTGLVGTGTKRQPAKRMSARKKK